MPQPSVRTATPGDAAVVHEVASDAWHAAHADIVGAAAVEDFLAEYYTVPALENSITNPETVFLVATLPGASDPQRPAGFVEAGPNDEAGVWTLARLYVTPAHFGEGVGTALLRAAEARVRDRDVDRLRLVVMADNERAVRFYEARGFTRVTARESQWATIDYVYAKTLD